MTRSRLFVPVILLPVTLLLSCTRQETDNPPFLVPTYDISDDTSRQTVVDREPGQYLGHPTTLRTASGDLLVVYPEGHGRGAIRLRRSTDDGRTWSDRLETPENWATSQETPTLFRFVDPEGRARIGVFSGLYPIRLALSDDDGVTFGPLQPIGDFGGIVAMSSVADLGAGQYLAFFHDDGRFLRSEPVDPGFFVYATRSTDGGLTWGEPEIVTAHPDADLCEPGLVWSPDGTEMALLLRENSRKHPSFVVFSSDSGTTWSEPRPLPRELTGDRHVAAYDADGHLLVTLRDVAPRSPHLGDWVLWIGSYEDLRSGEPGLARIRLMDNLKGNDCCYPGLEPLADGSFLTTTYGHWTADEEPYIVAVRFHPNEFIDH